MCDLLECKDCKNECKNGLNDKEIERLWCDLENIPIDEDECIDVDFQGWCKGTHREIVWKWFDSNHSQGVGYLMNDFE